jgi:Zn-dependent protease
MVFMPFVGAFISMKNQPRDAWEDAYVAYMGPLVGSAGAAAVAVAAHATDSQLLYALSDFGFMINLFNLLPIGSMDGGRIAGALSPYASVAGLGLGGWLAYEGVIGNPIFYLILMAGGYETFWRFYDPLGHTPPNYYRISAMQRVAITGGYFGLVAALIAAMGVNQRYRKPPEVLQRERQQELSFDMR